MPAATRRVAQPFLLCAARTLEAADADTRVTRGDYPIRQTEGRREKPTRPFSARDISEIPLYDDDVLPPLICPICHQ
jgi:hypothetical protein